MRAEYAFHSPFWDNISDSGIDVFTLIFILICERSSQIIIIIISSIIIIIIIIIVITIKVTYTLQLWLNPVDKPLLKFPRITIPRIHFVPVGFIR